MSTPHGVSDGGAGVALRVLSVYDVIISGGEDDGISGDTIAVLGVGVTVLAAIPTFGFFATGVVVIEILG